MAEKKTSTRQKKAIAPTAKSADAVAETLAEMQEAAVAPAPVQTVAASVPAPKRVDVALFWRMQHAAASMRAAKAEAETARLKKLYILALLDTKNRVLDTEKEIEKARKLAESHENTYLSFKRDIETRLGQPLANIAVDPDTGLVSHIPGK